MSIGLTGPTGPLRHGRRQLNSRTNMSVVINTNFAATLAANNLAASNGMLQKSLNRLSSGSKIVSPADDAGGLAVSMKLSAAAKRQGAAASNIGNSVSFLQSQDGALKTIGKVLERIGELKTLASDPTKNSTDIANYDAEFDALQDQLTSLSAEQFNGIDLFGSATMSVATTEDGRTTVEFGGIDLLGTTTTGFSFTDGVVGGSDVTTFTPTGAGTLTVTSGGLFIDGNDSSNFAHLDQVGDTASYDGVGGWTFSGAGVTVTGSLASGFTSVNMEGSMNTSWLGAATFTSAGGSNLGNVASAGSLASLSLGTVTDALQDVAEYRATNGGQQSRLGFAAEVLATNKANLEAANSRISDVDVAEESTQMARYNILVQAGTAMLGQANQSAQSALRLIG
jgi:flagellin